jgi:drug/metabolite transporter (DMT)-like permease
MSWRAWLVFAALGLVWGLPYLFIKLAVAEISPAGVAWGRIALAAAILLPIAWKRGGLKHLGAHKRAICAFALAELVGPFFLIARAGAARAAVITYINPAVAVLLGVIVLNERFGAGSALAMALILLGAWLANSARHIA